jgi:biofilm PGA synthesis N-glycosyltransferase PgaC
MWHFLSGARVGAVTGNPRIRNRSTLIGRVQIGEFSSTAGLLKRAQRTYGRLFSMSGVVAGFRKSSLHEVGYWSPDMLTEDIDITWKLEIAKWDVRFEPRALCWILMPETLKGLWRQRLRWAMGGAQVIFRRFREVRGWRERRMWPILLEYVVSMLWAYTMMTTFARDVRAYATSGIHRRAHRPDLHDPGGDRAAHGFAL